MLFFSSLAVLDKKEKLNDLNNLKRYLQYSTVAINFINVLQIERGLSAGYVGSHGKNLKSKLEEQRRIVDNYYVNTMMKNISYSKEFEKLSLNNTSNNIQNIQNFRKEIDKAQISLEDTLKLYNITIKDLIDSIKNISLISDNFELSRLISSYVSLTKAKEFTGIKRGMLHYSFNSQKFTAKDFSASSTFQTLYDTHIEHFQSKTFPEIRKEFNKIQQSDLAKEVQLLQLFIDNKMIKNELLSKMKALAGYGGLIHDFKNYVLRGDEKYSKRFNLKYNELINLIKEYKKLKSNKKEIKILRIVQFTFQQYKDKLMQIIQLKDDLNIEKLDQLVKIDDSLAIEALDKLSSGIIGINSDTWFDIMSEWISDLSYMENKLASKLFLKINNIQNNLQNILYIQVIFTLVLLIVVIILSFIIIKDILFKIKSLQDGLISFLDYVTKKTDNFYLLKVSGNDELSNMSNVLNKSIQQTSKHIEEEVKFAKSQERQIQESSKMVQMGEMIGNIAHQWRQPLSAISTIASSVRVNQEVGILDTKDIPKDMDKIVEKVMFLSETINIFRDFIKEDKEIKEINISKEIDKVLNISSPESYGIKVIKDERYNTNLNLKLFAGEFLQVLINILNNAKDVMVEKNISNKWIKIAIKQSNNMAIITIEDNGGGIPDKIIPKIFDPYFTTKHKSQGTGIGLYMSYDIIVNHFHGRMSVKNTNNGAKFFIELPLKE